jgi:tetratricopeptide (TPR) repeat protein
MKNIVIAVLLTVHFLSFGQTNQENNKQRIQDLVEKAQQNTITKEERKELRKNTFQIQNKGFRAADNSMNYSEALVYIDEALFIWKASRDSINEANNRKYRGLLLGYLGRFKEAKQEIDLAIDLFEQTNVAYGVAVSHFDLSKVYEFENKLDSAYVFNEKALAYWKKRGDTFRVLTINNQKVNLLTKSNELEQAKLVQEESQNLVKAERFHWQPLTDFYCVSYTLFSELNNQSRSDLYKGYYKRNIDSLSKENITFKSIYE